MSLRNRVEVIVEGSFYLLLLWFYSFLNSFLSELSAENPLPL